VAVQRGQRPVFADDRDHVVLVYEQSDVGGDTLRASARASDTTAEKAERAASRIRTPTFQ